MAETLADPMIGRLIDGRYEVRELVAHGGMATVYLAFDRRLERFVAIKILSTSFPGASDPREFSARFRREAKAAARLTHHGLVRVYDQGSDGDISYLTMEYIDGENLRSRLNHEATLTVGESLGILESVLDALAAAHREGLVHRDIKPENVLIDNDGKPKITDFGLARAVTEVTSTASGMIMGTVAYLGPELISRGYADARTDVYATGILLFEMVTGRQPFTAPSAIDVASRHVHEDVPAPSVYVPWLPPEVDDVVLTLAARDPSARPEDAAAALALVRQTRAMMDDPTLDRRADPPSGAVPVLDDEGRTTVLSAMPSGTTVALPIGLGQPLVDLGAVEAEIYEDDPEALPPHRDRPHPGVWISALIAGLALVFGLAAWWYNTQGPGAYTTIPSVTGYSAQEALQTLDSIGLEVITVTEFSDDVAAGFVIRTDPVEQSQVPNGSEVTIVVSDGPRMAIVPEVVGVSEEDAIQRIQDAGFGQLGETVRVHDDAIPAGTVMSVEPAMGEEVVHSTRVQLTISLGPAPITIPDVTGQQEASAVAQLENNYALVVTVVRERTPDQPKGVVFKTDPIAGSEGIRTQAITVYVSDGPPLITVPDFTAAEVDKAVEEAKNLGLRVELVPSRPWSSQRFVVDQDLQPGRAVEVGTKIILIYN